jgi:hypothetical protein
MELYLGILLGLVAVGLVVWAVVRPRKGEVPHCRRCGFSLAGLTEPGRCPECGSELARKRAVVIGERRRKRRPMWWAAGLVVVTASMLLLDRASVTGYMPVPEYKPAWLLAAEAYSLGDRRASMATDEIVRRVQSGALPVEQEERLLSISLARHAQTWRSFPDAQWMVITDAISARQLTTAEIRRVVANVFEDGFVFNSVDGVTTLEPGQGGFIRIGVRFRAGRAPLGAGVNWFGTMNVGLRLHEQPVTRQNTSLPLFDSTMVVRSQSPAGQRRFDSFHLAELNTPWIDGKTTGTATFGVNVLGILSFASDANLDKPGSQSVYVSREFPIEFEVVSTEKHRFPVLDIASLSGEVSNCFEFVSMPRPGFDEPGSVYARDYFLLLNQDAGIDWARVAIAGHIVLRQGERVERMTVHQPSWETRRIDVHLYPLLIRPFEPGEVRVSYEHNEALAAWRYRSDHDTFEQILGGPIELGTITIPEPTKPE